MSPIKLLPAALCAALLAVPGVADAAVYKCLNVSGKTIYQDAPCDKLLKGDEVIMKDAGGMGEPSISDEVWLKEAKPSFEASCPRMNGMARKTGNKDKKENVVDTESACRCVTRKYFSSAPIAKLRALEKYDDTAGIATITAPLIAECRHLNSKPVEPKL